LTQHDSKKKKRGYRRGVATGLEKKKKRGYTV
jgi:hypothetical protein